MTAPGSRSAGGFPCPRCGTRMDAKDTRAALGPNGPTLRRRRVCPACGHRMTTIEIEQGADWRTLRRMLTTITDQLDRSARLIRSKLPRPPAKRPIPKP